METWHSQGWISIRVFGQAIVCTYKGEVIKEGRIPTDKEDIEEFFPGLERLEIALEVTTNYEFFFTIC